MYEQLLSYCINNYIISYYQLKVKTYDNSIVQKYVSIGRYLGSGVELEGGKGWFRYGDNRRRSSLGEAQEEDQVEEEKKGKKQVFHLHLDLQACKLFTEFFIEDEQETGD